jgi:chromosome segregation ATPase
LRDFLHNIGLSMYNKNPTFIIHQNSVTNLKGSQELSNMIIDCSGSKKVLDLIHKTSSEVEKWKNVEISIEKSITNLQKSLREEMEHYENFCEFQDCVAQLEILADKRRILDENEKLNLVIDLKKDFEEMKKKCEQFKLKIESIQNSKINEEIKELKDLHPKLKHDLILLEGIHTNESLVF